jgi:tryptophanyl-tRNA synthetase
MHPMDFEFKKAIAENMDEMLAPITEKMLKKT